MATFWDLRTSTGGFAFLGLGLALAACGGDDGRRPGSSSDAGMPVADADEPADAAQPRDGGGGGGGASPALEGLVDVWVAQNTLRDATVEVTFTATDPDDPASDLSVALASTDSAVVPDATGSCSAAGDCTVSIAVHRSEPAMVDLTVTATDPSGASASGTFTLDVSPRPVMSPADSGAASLRAVVGVSEDGDVIEFQLPAPGNVALLSQVVLDRTLTFQGPGADMVVLNGSAMTRIFDVTAEGSVEISGVTLRNGKAPEDENGGCIRNAGTLTLRDSVLTLCDADGDSGGAISNADGATVVLEGAELSSNQADFGGAIYSRGGSVRIERTLVSDNAADATGGAIYNWGELVIVASTFSGNTCAGGGGAVLNDEGTVLVTNSTISDNSASSGGGGGIFNLGGTVTVAHSTVTGNASLATSSSDVCRGGGLYNNASGTMSLGGSIVYGNVSDEEGPDLWGTIASSGHNVVGDPTDVTFTGDTSSITIADPALGPLQDNGGPTPTRAPASGSPAIDLVPASACKAADDAALETDQRLLARPMGTACDAGAVEAG